ncbi:unnamed protein product [Rotaria socialis]|uniref:Uncharacterized protein n=1 Tax=Rotaria socialis TaxID=392032 RepID=A0A818Y212_9BILA|nr:unnamed protein product [Rotaria socialis]
MRSLYATYLTINSTTGIKTLKGSALHQQNILVRTLEPARHSLKLTNTHSPKSISLHDNEQSLTGKSTIATPSTIHESDEGIVENNSDDDEDAARSSSLIVTTYASLRSTIRRTTVTSLTSAISLTGSSNMIENNLNGQQLIHSTNRNNNNGINSTIAMNTMSMIDTFMTTSDDSFRISHIHQNFSFCRR